MTVLMSTSGVLVLRTVPDPRKRRARSALAGRATRRAVTALFAAVVALAVWGVAGLGPTAAGPATAGITDAFCGYRDTTWSPRVAEWPGSGALAGPLGSDKPLRGPLTAYEAFGWAGAQWPTAAYTGDPWKADCPLTTAPGNLVASMVLGAQQTVVQVGLTVFAWATTADAVTPFLGSVAAVLAALRDALLLQYLTPLIMVVALTVAWQGLVRKRASEALQSTVWTVASAALAIVFLSSPALVARVINTAVTSVSVAAMDAATSTTGRDESQSMCALPRGAPDRGTRMARCTYWAVFGFQPWATGLFGPTATKGLETAPRLRATDGLTAAVPAVRIPGHQPSRDLTLSAYASMSWSQRDVAAAADSGYTSEQEAEKNAQWLGVKEVLQEDPRARSAISHFTGDDWSGRLMTAIVGLLAVVFAALPLLLLSFSLVAAQIEMVVLLLIAPFTLTIGVHPSMRRVALGWLERLLATAIKRFVATGLIAVVLLMMGLITSGAAGQSWTVQVLLIAATSFAAVKYRKAILKQASRVNLGGDGGASFAPGGNPELSARRSGARVVGGLTAGVGHLRHSTAGARRAGLLSSVVRGAQAGSAAGSPARAAATGYGTGRAAVRGRTAGRLRADEQARAAAQARHEIPGSTGPATAAAATVRQTRVQNGDRSAPGHPVEVRETDAASTAHGHPPARPQRPVVPVVPPRPSLDLPDDAEVDAATEAAAAAEIEAALLKSQAAARARRGQAVRRNLGPRRPGATVEEVPSPPAPGLRSGPRP